MRRFLSRYILTMLFCSMAGLLCCSCIYDEYDESRPTSEQGELMQFILRIDAEGTGSTQPNDVVEMVNSLRVIVIDKDTGKLDINEKVSLASSEYIAKNFSYLFVRSLNYGDKRVFLIANEEKIGEVSLTDKTGIPNALPMTSLTAMLDYFKVDKVEKNSTDASVGAQTNFVGNTFADVLNSVYFKNKYEISGNKISLPYSAYYELNVPQGESPIKQMEQTLHLVPVATKFDFVFTNYRKTDAYINDIIISRLNSFNYLNAQLDETEKYRVLPGEREKIWWIDWLDACSRGSQSTDNSDNYNGQWGWITKYYLPQPDEQMADLALNSDKKIWMLDGLVNISNPSTLILGPFYAPESSNRFIPDADSAPDSVTDTEQTYSLTFKMADVSNPTDEQIITFEDNVIDSLKALFRATHVNIYVELYESKAEIYAEIVPWDVKKFWGYVQQDSDYS